MDTERAIRFNRPPTLNIRTPRRFDEEEVVPFTPIDPFEASMAFSVKNLRSSRSDTYDLERDNLHSRPSGARRLARRNGNFDLGQGQQRHQAGFRHGRQGGVAPRTSPVDHLEVPEGPGHLRRSSLRESSRFSSSSGSSSSSDDGNHSDERAARPRSHFSEPSKSTSSHGSYAPSVEEVEEGLGRPHPEVVAKPAEECDNKESTSGRKAVAQQPIPLSALAEATKSELVFLEPHSFTAVDYIVAFCFDTLPRQMYLYLLLTFPRLYFSRVSRIFEEADLSQPQIKRGIVEAAAQLKEPHTATSLYDPPTSFGNLEKSWSMFVDSLLREWKTLNIISVLLLSAILTILQIDTAADEPITRFSALLSMICALMSLLYGCIFIIRFGTMRKTYKALEWVEESRGRTGLWWNVWVLLAMPATWLAWSMILYIVCIMSFVWRTGTVQDANRGQMTESDALAPRIIVSVVLALGIIYFLLISSTLRRYGDLMDRKWKKRLDEWMNDPSPVQAPPPNYRSPTAEHDEHRVGNPLVHIDPPQSSHHTRSPTHDPASNISIQSASSQPPAIKIEAESGYAESPAQAHPDPDLLHSRDKNEKTEVEPSANIQVSETMTPKIRMVKLIGLSEDDALRKEVYQDDLDACKISSERWEELSTEILASWDPYEPENISPVLARWNDLVFLKDGGQIALCRELASTLNHAVYHFATTQKLNQKELLYDCIPAHLQRLDVYPSENGSEHSVNRIEPLTLFSTHQRILETSWHQGIDYQPIGMSWNPSFSTRPGRKPSVPPIRTDV